MSQTLDDGKLSVLGTAGSRGISAKQLDNMLNRHIADDVEILLVFAQCYGGNMARSRYFESRANTCVLSGTDRGQEAGYGGYHDDAARSLKPGDNRHASDVHKGGGAGIRALYPDDSNEAKVWNEEPIITGGLDAEAFSLDPVSENGPVIARQLVIYCAQPEEEFVNLRVFDDATIPTPGKGGERRIGDNIDRDQIIKNFKDEANTGIRTVGGEANPQAPDCGINDWDAPGTQAALDLAIKGAGALLGQTTGGGKKQFILYVGDHGVGTRRDEFDSPVSVPAGQQAMLLDGITPFEAESAFAASMKRSKDAVPGYELIIDVPANFDPDSGLPFPISTDALSLSVSNVTCDTFEWSFEKGEAGSESDSVRLVFPARRKDFIDQLAREEPMSASLNNDSEVDLTVHGFVQTTGAISRSMGPLRGILPTLLGGWFWHTKA